MWARITKLAEFSRPECGNCERLCGSQENLAQRGLFTCVAGAATAYCEWPCVMRAAALPTLPIFSCSLNPVLERSSESR